MTGEAFDLVVVDALVLICPGRATLRDFDSGAFLTGADSGVDLDVDVFAALFFCCSFSRLASLRAFFFASFQGEESIPLALSCHKRRTQQGK